MLSWKSTIGHVPYMTLSTKQGCSHEIWSGTVAVGGDATEGSDIKARIANHSAQSAEQSFSPSFFSYQDGLSWHLRALKTRKHHFQTIWSHRSLALSTVAMWLPTGLLGVLPNFMNIGRNVVVASKSGRVETRPTWPVTTALPKGGVGTPMIAVLPMFALMHDRVSVCHSPVSATAVVCRYVNWKMAEYIVSKTQYG